MPAVTIEVTADDIKHGRQYEVDTCAVARAIKRALPGARELKVSGFGIDFWNPLTKATEVCEVPKKVAAFIKAFDKDRNSVKPTSFTLRY